MMLVLYSTLCLYTYIASKFAAQCVTVKVSHIPKDFSKEQLSHCLRNVGGPVEVSLQSTDQELNYAWLNCKDKTTAERVVKKLHGAAVGEERIMLVAHLHQQGTCVLCMRVVPLCCSLTWSTFAVLFGLSYVYCM